MYICICQGITDRQIIEAIKQGHDSAAIAAILGAGSCCGRCSQTVESLVESHAKPAVYHAA